nr:MAG TPA: hypothetical protein [Caudoviricetes sp.]
MKTLHSIFPRRRFVPILQSKNNLNPTPKHHFVMNGK